MANNAEQLPPFQPAQKFSPPVNVSLPHLFYPPELEYKYMPLCPIPSNNASLLPSNPNVWRIPASVPASSMPLVGTSVNLNKVPLSQFSNSHVPQLTSKAHVEAAIRS